MTESSSTEPSFPQSSSNERGPSTNAVIAEYQSLAQFINSRRSQQMTLNSIAITGAIFVLNFALSGAKSLGLGPFSWPIASWMALFAIFLIVIAWVNWRGLVLIDKHTYQRIREIESLLGIRGHSGVYDQLSKRLLYRARYWLWDIFYSIILVASVATTIYLRSG